MSNRTVLITGCSNGGLGSALAIAFHKAGYQVIATARNLKKISNAKDHGIECLEMDVTSEDSIEACVQAVRAVTNSKLSILVNNAGAAYSMPVLDLSQTELRKIFDLNVYSLIAVSRAFFPLLQQAERPMIVNNTSIGSVFGPPFSGAYNASKAADAMLTENLRLELQPFGIRVVDLRTGVVQSNFYENFKATIQQLPINSIYNVAKDDVESVMRERRDTQEAFPLLSNGPRRLSMTFQSRIHRHGFGAVDLPSWYGSPRCIPMEWFDGTVRKAVGLDIIEGKVKASALG